MQKKDKQTMTTAARRRGACIRVFVLAREAWRVVASRDAEH
jgi:hypothetical protein